MATLNIWNAFSVIINGILRVGKHGAASGSRFDPLAATVVGLCHQVSGQVATAAVATPYEKTGDVPQAFAYLFFWADQDTYLQLIGSSQNVVFKVKANTPFVLPGFGTLRAQANATPIAGGAEPAPVTVDTIVVGNYSGSIANYELALVQ